MIHERITLLGHEQVDYKDLSEKEQAIYRAGLHKGESNADAKWMVIIILAVFVTVLIVSSL